MARRRGPNVERMTGEELIPLKIRTPGERAAYRDGFAQARLVVAFWVEEKKTAREVLDGLLRIERRFGPPAEKEGT